MTICPLGAELFYTDGRTDKWTDMTKIIVTFRYFANAPKNRPKIENFVTKDQLHFLIDENNFIDNNQSLILLN